MRGRPTRSITPRILGLNTLLARDDRALPDDDDDCPICRQIRAQGIPSATFDLRGRMLSIEKPSERPRTIVQLELDDGGSSPIEVSLPDTSSYRDLLELVEPFVGPDLLNGPPTADGAAVSLDDRVVDGSVVRFGSPRKPRCPRRRRARPRN